MKKTILLLVAVAALGISSSFAQKERFLKSCVDANKKADNIAEITEYITPKFSLSEWTTVLHDQCEATIDKKTPKFLTYISKQRETVDALLKLAALCPDNKDFQKIQPDLKYLKDVYDGVDTETEVVEGEDEGFSGLFDEEETTNVSVTIKQVKKLRKRAAIIKRKIK